VKSKFQEQIAKVGVLDTIQEIMNDNGTEFKGEFAKFLKNKEIDILRTKPRDPHLNGSAERTVR
jgi:transposase InsO family protein